MDGQVMFWMTFWSLVLQGNKQPSTKVAYQRKDHKSVVWRVSFIYWCNWLHISSIWIGLYYIVCTLYFISAAFRMDGSGSSWMTLPKALPHRYKQLPKHPELKRHGIHPLHLNLMERKHFITLKVEHNPIFYVSHSWRPRKWMDARLWTWMTCLKLLANRCKPVKHIENIGKTTEIGLGEEGNTTLTLVIHISMFSLQYWICSLIRSWLKILEKEVSLSLNVKNISFQQLLS